MFNLFKLKSKYYGNYKWKIECNICKYENKCIDFTNNNNYGIQVKLISLKPYSLFKNK